MYNCNGPVESPTVTILEYFDNSKIKAIKLQKGITINNVDSNTIKELLKSIPSVRVTVSERTLQGASDLGYLCFEIEKADFSNIHQRAIAPNLQTYQFDLLMRCVHLLNPINMSQFQKQYNAMWCCDANFDNLKLPRDQRFVFKFMQSCLTFVQLESLNVQKQLKTIQERQQHN